MVTRRQEQKEALLDANAGCLLAFVLVFGVPLLAGGLFFLVLGFRTMHEQARLNTAAREVDATILSSEVGRSVTRRTNSTSGSVTCYPKVTFSYDAGGAGRVSDRVWVVPESRDEAWARRVVTRYPAGGRVKAYMDPADPSVAFLEKRWSQMPYIGVGVCGLVWSFVVSLAVVLAGWRRPGVAGILALWVAVCLAGAGMAALRHYLVSMPPDVQSGWVWVGVVVYALACLGPVAALAKARSVHRVYRGALRERASKA